MNIEKQKALDVMNDIFDIVFPIVKGWHWHEDFEKHPDGMVIQLNLNASIMYRLNDARNVIRDALDEYNEIQISELRLLIRRLSNRLPKEDAVRLQATDYLIRTFKAADILRTDEEVGRLTND